MIFRIQGVVVRVDIGEVNCSADPFRAVGSAAAARDAIIDRLVEALETPPVGVILVEFLLEHGPMAPDRLPDDVRQELKRRIAGCLAARDTVLQAGIDTLAVVKPSLAAPAETEGLAFRLLNALGGPVHCNGRRWICQPTIGAAISRQGDTPAELLHYAEHALGDARMLGGDMVVVFEDADRELLIEE